MLPARDLTLPGGPSSVVSAGVTMSDVKQVKVSNNEAEKCNLDVQTARPFIKGSSNCWGSNSARGAPICDLSVQQTHREINV